MGRGDRAERVAVEDMRDMPMDASSSMINAMGRVMNDRRALAAESGDSETNAAVPSAMAEMRRAPWVMAASSCWAVQRAAGTLPVPSQIGRSVGADINLYFYPLTNPTWDGAVRVPFAGPRVRVPRPRSSF